MTQEQLLFLLKKYYSKEIVSLTLLRESGGKTYVVTGEKSKYLLKVVGEAFRDTARKGVKISQYLFQHNFPVPKIIETSRGDSYLEITEDGNTILLILYEFLDGNEPNIQARAEDIGILVGRFHKLMQWYKEPLLKREQDFFVERYLNILQKKRYSRWGEYAKLGHALWKRIEQQPVYCCHGDLHRGNLLETPEGKLYLLDFDTACLAPHMFDVMVMCDMTNYFKLQLEDLEQTREIYCRFLQTYTQMINLTKQEISSIYDWIALRHFQLQATIVEIYGLDCIDDLFIDQQLEWLEAWKHTVNQTKIGP